MRRAPSDDRHMSSPRGSFLASAAFVLVGSTCFCHANASSGELLRAKTKGPERIVLQYLIRDDARASSQFVAILDGGMRAPLILTWELPKPRDNKAREAQERQKRQFEKLIETLEQKEINGIEFECRGQWLQRGVVVKVMSVPQLTKSGKRRSNLDASLSPTVSEEEYEKIPLRIFHRIADLKPLHPSLRNMTDPARHEHELQWVLDDPQEPHSKLNGRRAVFGKDGYWFSLQFYRGQWAGSAMFHAIEFGDLKLWFDFGHGGNASVIQAVTSILREEHDAFCTRHPGQTRDRTLQQTGTVVIEPLKVP
jgi:hypothetical protein